MTTPLEYVYARKALLDALDALGSQRQCVVLIGSQAIYLQSAADDLHIPPMTTDADIALDTTLISDEPELGAALQAAQFSCPGQPGHWVNPSGVAVDLMVAPHQSGRSKATARAARISPHTHSLARIGEGLAPALTQWSVISVEALDDEDHRAHRIKVAGLGALLVAKTIKLRDRLTDQQRGQHCALSRRTLSTCSGSSARPTRTP